MSWRHGALYLSQLANRALTSLGASATHNKTVHQGTVANNAIDGNPSPTP